MSYAKMAEPIEMPFGMLSHIAPGNVLHGDVYAATGTGTFGVSARLKSIAKHRILGSG